MKRRSTFAMAAVAVLFATQARSQVSDHQQCFKIKDSEAKTRYTATLIPGDGTFPTATDCTIKVPAKFLCIDTTKTNVSPPPPGAPPADQAGITLCYKTKCPKMAKTPWVAQDQFGSRVVTAKKTGMLCAPATHVVGSCTTPADCPGTDTECQARECVDNTCGVDVAPEGTVTQTQTAGNCQRNECDGQGNIVSAADDTDVPNDNNECTTDTCLAGVPAFAPVAEQTACNAGAGVCVAGTCVAP
jgi:hypothetical protein